MLRSLAIFLAGAVLGTGVRRRARLLPVSLHLSAAAGRRAAHHHRPRQRRSRAGHVHPRQPERSHPLGQGQRVGARRTAYSWARTSRSGPAPSSTSIWCRRRQIRASGDLAGQKFVDLGRLRSFKGSQRYAIPAGVDLAKYQSVIIWCEQFSVLISPADLMRKELIDSRTAKARPRAWTQQGMRGRMTRIGLPARDVRPLVDRTAACLATVPGHVPDLVPVDADIAQHPLIQAAQRLRRPAMRAARPQTSHIVRPSSPLDRPAASLADGSAKGQNALSLLKVKILNMVSPPGRRSGAPGFASMLNCGEPLAIAARHRRAISSEDRGNRRVAALQGVPGHSSHDHRSICLFSGATSSYLLVGEIEAARASSVKIR